MTVALPFAGIGGLVDSPSESAAFGFSVARLSIGGAWATETAEPDAVAEQVSRAVLAAPHHTVIVRYPTELVVLAAWDWPAGIRAQHAGTLVYWEDASLADPPLPTNLAVEIAQTGEQPTSDFVADSLSVIADSFDGYVNHYSYNREIRSNIVRDGYVEWARRTIGDETGAAILLRSGSEAVAAATLRLHSDERATVAEVELASVSRARQGSGHYRELWQSIRSVTRRSGADRLVISTQASNIRVQRAWARVGLVPLASFDTLHVSRVIDPTERTTT